MVVEADVDLDAVVVAVVGVVVDAVVVDVTHLVGAVTVDVTRMFVGYM